MKDTAKNYAGFNIRGKLGKIVLMLPSPSRLQCIEMLLQHRPNMHIAVLNKFVFGIPSSRPGVPKHLRAYNLLSRFSKKCAVEMTSSLRGTTLRKHIAQLDILLNLNEDKVAPLSNFMGHGKNIACREFLELISASSVI